MSRRNGFQKLLPLLILVAIVIFIETSHHKTDIKGAQTTNPNLPTATAPAGSLSLVTEPNVGNQSVLTLIDGAKKSVDMVMYELQDTQVEQALVSAHNRGVAVRVLLNGGYYGTPDKNQPNKNAYEYLQKNGVDVHYTPGYFALTHQKTLVVDGTTGLIMTFNLQPQYYATSRDFGVIDRDSHDVSAIESAFDADWQQQKITAPAGDGLIWSPGSESATVSLINQAQKSIKVYNEEMADKKVVAALGNAAMRGVDVQVVMTDQKSWHQNFSALKSKGAHISTFHGETPLYIHAKMIIVDNNKAFLGSENFSVTSLEKNRELGLATTDKAIITSLNNTFDNDFQIAAPY